jgi:hypothetical protein
VLQQRGPEVARSAAAAAEASRGWREVTRERRLTDRSAVVVVYRRAAAEAAKAPREITPPAPTR